MKQAIEIGLNGTIKINFEPDAQDFSVLRLLLPRDYKVEAIAMLGCLGSRGSECRGNGMLMMQGRVVDDVGNFHCTYLQKNNDGNCVKK